MRIGSTLREEGGESQVPVEVHSDASTDISAPPLTPLSGPVVLRCPTIFAMLATPDVELILQRQLNPLYRRLDGQGFFELDCRLPDGRVDSEYDFFVEAPSLSGLSSHFWDRCADADAFLFFYRDVATARQLRGLQIQFRRFLQRCPFALVYIPHGAELDAIASVAVEEGEKLAKAFRGTCFTVLESDGFPSRDVGLTKVFEHIEKELQNSIRLRSPILPVLTRGVFSPSLSADEMAEDGRLHRTENIPRVRH